EISERIYPVGRLDYLSEGLLLLTNDGDLAQNLIHPKNEIPRVYEVKVSQIVDERLLRKLRKGVSLSGCDLRPLSVRIIKHLPTKTWLEFRLGEGKNREIRRICKQHGLSVDKLRRVALGGLSIEGLPVGKFRSYSKKQLLSEIKKEFSILKKNKFRFSYRRK
ncbi:MAG: pseudouridine synthase, partial [Halobacteriovoraceae bacterium]|nr:pseudouridine synthase [Halobacteriovoraceae bacterium]